MPRLATPTSKMYEWRSLDFVRRVVQYMHKCCKKHQHRRSHFPRLEHSDFVHTYQTIWFLFITTNIVICRRDPVKSNWRALYIYIYIYISAKYTLYRLIHITVVGLTTLLTRQYYNDHLTMYVTLIISFNCMRQICYNGRCMSNARRAGRYVQRPQCVYKMCGFRGIFVGVVYIYKLIWVVDIQGMFSSISGRPFSIESVRIITCLSIEA